MKNLFKIFLVSIVITSSAYSQKVEQGLIGKWETDVIANSKIGAIWQFNKDKSVEITSGAIVHYVYIFKGKVLISALFNHITGETTLDTSFVEIKGDSLFQKYKVNGDEKSRVMIRVGNQKNKMKPEVGTWETKNIAGQKSFYQFNNDHTLILRVPISVQKGTYSIKDFTLTLKLKDLEEEHYSITFLSHSLILKSTVDKNEKTFHRLYD